MTRPRSRVIKAKKNDVWQVHETYFDVKYARRRLDHRLQTMARSAGHHHRTRELHQELFSLNDLGGYIPRNLNA